MIMTTSFVFMSMFLCSMVTTFFNRKQLLLILLSLELVLLSNFLLLFFSFPMMGQSIATSFYLLILGACEASLGLSLLVVLTRMSGSDMLSLLGIMKS